MRARVLSFFFFVFCLVLCFAGAKANGAHYDLKKLEKITLEHNLAATAAREQVSVARAGVDIAGSFPNPELEFMAGKSKILNSGNMSGNVHSVTLTQPLDMPWQRAPRIEIAQLNVKIAQANYRGFEATLLSQLRLRYLDLLRRETELKNAEEDVALVQEMHRRILAKVKSGESARFELIKSEAELLNTRKLAQTASLRVIQARQALCQITGVDLGTKFTIDPVIDLPKLPNLHILQEQMLALNPDVEQVRFELSKAEKQLAYERIQRWPSISLKASSNQDSEVRDTQLGLSISIPLWNRRQGFVNEAGSQILRAKYALENQIFSAIQDLEIAYKQYEIAQTQVAALESGIIKQAELALRAAEVGYRFGDRGFLEVLDAQRIFRAARSELIYARHELLTAWVGIQRLVIVSKENTL